MRLGLAALAAGLLAAGPALAAPAVEFQDVAARVVVAPEDRQDLKVEVMRPNPNLPLRIWGFAGRMHVAGGLGRRLGACHRNGGRPSVSIAGVGEIPVSALPYVVVRTPLHARVFVAGAVWGSAGRSDGLDFSNSGCGDWLVADVRNRMRLTLAGRGGVRTGDAGSAELSVGGEGSIATGHIRRGLTALSAGPGAIEVARVDGPFVARIAGPGSIHVVSGDVTLMEATVAGAGAVVFDGMAHSLKASIIGSGDVRVARVTGPVLRSVIGRGEVRIGPGPPPAAPGPRVGPLGH